MGHLDPVPALRAIVEPLVQQHVAQPALTEDRRQAGPQAGELIHCFSGPITMGATVRDLLRAPWYHPTLAEILTYPLEEIAGKLPD